MLSSTIDYLRKQIASHPGFNDQFRARISQNGKYTIDNCSPNTLKWLAFQLNIPFIDKDGRGRPRKPGTLPITPTPVNTVWNPPVTPTPVIVEPQPVIIEPTPVNAPATPQTGSLDAIIRYMINEALQGFDPALNEEKVISLIAAHGQTIIQRPINIYPNHTQTTPSFTLQEGEYHYKFPMVLSAVTLHLNVYLVGPTGSGKTHLCEQIAKALSLRFFGFAAMTSEYKMCGFVNAQGGIVHTQFKEAYINGGVACLDEIDSYSAAALLALNAALANGWAEFADGMKQRHPDFYCIAGANTIGIGPSKEYVGRQALDAASLNRFLFIDLPYDAHLEAAMVGADCYDKKQSFSFTPRQITNVEATQMFNLMRAIRSEAQIQKVKLIVSPRSTQMAVKLYAAGWSLTDILASAVWKGLDPDTVLKIAATTAFMEAAAPLIN